MQLVGTTAAELVRFNEPGSIVVHADSTNTDFIKISGTDPSVTLDYDELTAGQSMTFFGLKDTVIYCLANSGTQKVHLPFIQYGTGFLLVTK